MKTKIKSFYTSSPNFVVSMIILIVGVSIFETYNVKNRIYPDAGILFYAVAVFALLLVGAFLIQSYCLPFFNRLGKFLGSVGNSIKRIFKK